MHKRLNKDKIYAGILIINFLLIFLLLYYKTSPSSAQAQVQCTDIWQKGEQCGIDLTFVRKHFYHSCMGQDIFPTRRNGIDPYNERSEPTVCPAGFTPVVVDINSGDTTDNDGDCSTYYRTCIKQ